ncbi:MAG: hypothetical protein JSR66_23700 [Proteobacteria bacterium]|nr:hypothetical protein [Pseudomonadota bacterium]
MYDLMASRSCVAVLSLMASGCVTTNFTQPVASFQQSINSSSASLGTYFTQLNTLERDIYFEELATDPQLDLAAINKDGKRTAFGGKYFSADAIKARMDALALLGTYAQRLADLAGSDPGTQFATNVNALGTSLSSLDKTFTHLATASGGKPAQDPVAAQYAGPISDLIGTIGKMYLEGQRDKAIAEAVNHGSPKVDVILNLLEADLTAVVVPLVNADLKYQEGLDVQDYNHRRAKLTTEQRSALLVTIGQRADAYDAAVAANPAGLIQSIRTANAALVKYANAPKSPHNLSEFLSALQTLAQSAQDIADDVNKIEAVR